jgi:hypothetical protein
MFQVQSEYDYRNHWHILGAELYSVFRLYLGYVTLGNVPEVNRGAALLIHLFVITLSELEHSFIPINFSIYLILNMNRGTVVGITTGYGLDDRGSRNLTSPYRPDRLWGPTNLLPFPLE